MNYWFRAIDNNLYIFTKYLRNKQLEILKDYLNDNQFDNNMIFDYFTIACEYKSYIMIDYLINEYNFDINCENTAGETIIYRLCRNDDLNEIIVYLIEKHDLNVDISNNIYLPLFNCFVDHYAKNNFKLLLKNNIDLNLIDQMDKNILFYIIPYNDLDLLKEICMKYIEKYSFIDLKRWIEYNDSIYIALQYNFFHIAKYLCYMAMKVPKQRIFLTRSGKYKFYLKNNKKFIPTHINEVGIKRYDPTFNEFYVIYKKINLDPFDIISQNDLRSIYELSNEYAFYDIYKAIHMCVISKFKIDYDSVLYCLRKIREEHYANSVQCIYKYNFRKNEKKNKNKIIKNIKVLQKKWRRKKYIGKSKENCTICLNYLIEKKCYKLNCSHIFHKECLNKWRIDKNECPNCREKIINYGYNL